MSDRLSQHDWGASRSFTPDGRFRDLGHLRTLFKEVVTEVAVQKKVSASSSYPDGNGDGGGGIDVRVLSPPSATGFKSQRERQFVTSH